MNRGSRPFSVTQLRIVSPVIQAASGGAGNGDDLSHFPELAEATKGNAAQYAVVEAPTFDLSAQSTGLLLQEFLSMVPRSVVECFVWVLNGSLDRVTGDDIAHIIGAVGTLLWVLLAAFVIWLLRQPLTVAVSRLATFEAFGVKFALSGGAALDAAIELAQKNPNWSVEVPAVDRKAALDRANANRAVFEGAEILWVDDRPSNNRNEAHMLRSFGALVTFAATTDEASRALQTAAEQHQPFDLILSDISRDLPNLGPTAGLTMLTRLRNAGFNQPVIYYVGRPDPGAGVPAGAFGLTNRPDQLLQLTIDALSRVRGRA